MRTLALRLGTVRFALMLGALTASIALGQEKPSPPSTPAVGSAAGTVDFMEGDSFVEAKDGRARLPKVGDLVYASETVTTFGGAELHLKMVDGAYLSLRENTKITIAEYVANGDDSDRSILDLAKGTFRAVTGWIGKYRRAAYQVRTPTVTIGVRGTDHEPTHLPVGDSRGEPGTYDKVNEGSTFLQSQFGTVEVPADRVVFFSPERRAPPRLLASTPAFFKPARNEQRFIERSRESTQSLAAQRETRRDVVRKDRGRDGDKAGAKSELRPPQNAQRPAKTETAPHRAQPQKPPAQPRIEKKAAATKAPREAGKAKPPAAFGKGAARSPDRVEKKARSLERNEKKRQQ
jgi:hypothetical protein